MQDTPSRIVTDGKVTAWGRFRDPFRVENLDDLALRIGGVPMPRPLRKLRLKEWQHVAVVGADLSMAFALVDTHYIANAFCWTARPDGGDFVEHHREAPAFAVDIAKDLFAGTCRFDFAGWHARIENRLDERAHRVRLDIAASRGRPGIAADLVLHEDVAARQPLVVVLPLEPERPMYTHKSACPIEGTVTVGERRHVLDPARDFALLDVQKTYYPYRTFWRWATFAGRDAEGRVLAVNLVHNLIRDDESFNENGLWVDGVLHPLSAARFEFDPADLDRPWRIRTTDHRIDLTFTPVGRREGRVNAIAILSDYKECFGRFDGTVVDASGRVFRVEGLRGVAEDHRARF
jgi:hypothetical protein